MKRDEVIESFQLDGTIVHIGRHGSGHINDTFLLKLRKDDGDEARVILQRMNKACRTYGKCDGRHFFLERTNY